MHPDDEVSYLLRLQDGPWSADTAPGSSPDRHEGRDVPDRPGRSPAGDDR